jgi:four helix bundle protein
LEFRARATVLLICIKMFDFEKLEVYKKTKQFNINIYDFLKLNGAISSYLYDQLRRAGLSISLNIAEGSGRMSKRDKRNFFVIARGSAFECVAILEILLAEKQITLENYNKFYNQLEEISKMLYALSRSLE